MASVIFSALVEVFIVADWEHNGTEMITPFPVPIHKRLQETSNAVIRTNENPNFPVPVDEIIEAYLMINVFWHWLYILLRKEKIPLQLKTFRKTPRYVAIAEQMYRKQRY